MDIPVNKPVIKAGIKRDVKYTRAGQIGSHGAYRPTFTIMNIATVTVAMPKWWVQLISNKLLTPREVEFNFRKLQVALRTIDLELVSYSWYGPDAYIQVKSLLDGSPVDARETLKSQLRLFRVAMKEFSSEFKERVDLLRDYKRNKNGNICYCPAGPRKGLHPS